MSSPTSPAEHEAARAVRLVEELGTTIDHLASLGCIVSLDISFNAGSESVTLHRLNGEFDLEVGLYHSLTNNTGANNP